MMEIMEIIRITIALFGTGIAAYYDMFNRKNVPDVFLYSFLGISLLINVFDYSLFLKFIPVMLLLIAILFILYRFGQIGGADVIVLAAIYASLPVFPMNQEQIIPSSLMVLAIATVLASIWIIVKYGPKIIDKMINGKLKISVWQGLEIVVLMFSFFFLVYVFMMFPFLPFWIILIAAILFLESVFFIVGKEQLTEEMIVMKKKIEPEDVIAVERIDEKLVKKYNIKRLTDEKQARILNKTGKKWPVMDMPMFVPFILVGLLVYLIIGII